MSNVFVALFVSIVFVLSFALLEESQQCDLNQDGEITITDLSILAEQIRYEAR